MDPIAQLVILVILLILSGFFSSAETALTTVNKLKLRTLSEEGKKRATKVLAVTENSGKLLSTILIGNNIVNISASALATTLCTEVFGSKFIGISTGILTVLVLIFGEVTPKTLAAKYSIQLSMLFVYPIWILMIILTPAVWLLNIITGTIFKILHVDTSDKGDTMTESELRTIFDVSHEDGVLETSEKFMISNVVDFGDALSKDIMIPRADVVFADINATYEELVSKFSKETYSRIPIYEDSKDNVVGLLYIKDLFFYKEKHGTENFDARNVLRKPLFVYEYQKTSQIFADMKTSSVTMAVVLDEYGVTSGIITMEDLIEEIVGEIRDEYDTDEADYIKVISENVYDIDASIKLNDLNDALDIKLTSEDYDSLAGFVIELLDKLPDEGDAAKYKNLDFKVTKVNRNRVERITLSIEPEKKNDDKEEGAVVS
ncbi:MAG: hemolysin family protein [Clostridium sp.]|nr:hemolysin family protein [Clostridium sp.]MCM1209187.1 hemolysin family protein [Ruminococcus sp.]